MIDLTIFSDLPKKDSISCTKANYCALIFLEIIDKRGIFIGMKTVAC